MESFRYTFLTYSLQLLHFCHKAPQTQHYYIYILQTILLWFIIKYKFTYKNISLFAITIEHAHNPNVKILGDKLKEATVHFQWQQTLHFFKNILLKTIWYSSLHMWISCEIQVSWRNEAQIVSKIQVRNVFVKEAKFTLLKMHNSLLVFISSLISKY